MNIMNIEAGTDNGWTVLHPSRYLPGAECSAVKQLLVAREAFFLTSHQPLGNYDMSDVSFGWLHELHSMSRSKLALILFSIKYCNAKMVRANNN
jgi:hypothetical protein